MKKQKKENKGTENMKKYVWIKMKRFGISHHGGMAGKINRTF